MGKQMTMLGLDKTKEENVSKIFKLLKKRENVMVADTKTRLNSTEVRLLCEIVSASCDGRRLISTQLADLLGVTRSAISQIVNRLESAGIVCRVADEIDRKIAYIEVSEAVIGEYGKDIEECLTFVNDIVLEFGQEKFDKMYALCEEFFACAEVRMKERVDKKKNKK